MTITEAKSTIQVPRIAIKFCTQCKWNLRAAYFAQELLQTFGAALGEVALIPVTGGMFTVTMVHPTASGPQEGEAPSSVTESIIWDRKTEGGFPETKELKNRVRNIIEPGRDLGHIDRSLKKKQQQQQQQIAHGGLSEDREDNSEASLDRPDAAAGRPQPISNAGTGTDRTTLAVVDGEGNARSPTTCEDCK